MPAGDAVRPGRWEGIVVLFDNNEYSVIAGNYDGNHRLGQRWNGPGNAAGFPSQGGHPIFHVTPPYLSRTLLVGLLEVLVHNTNIPDRDLFVSRIISELACWCERLSD